MPGLFRLVLLFIGFMPGSVPAHEPLHVFVSIPPQRYLVNRIGREHVDVRVMLQPGDSPETFDPSLRQIKQLQFAQIYFRIGFVFEEKWIRNVDNEKSQMKVVDCCDEIMRGRPTKLDNHVWTSPHNARILAAMIKNELVLVDPEHAQAYAQNYRGLVAALEQLDKYIHALLSRRRTDYFIMSHAALGHFADDFGLIQLSLENQGREPGARGLVTMIKLAKQEKLHTLFVQGQHKSPASMAFANEIGARTVVIDPLSGNYIANLRRITQLLASALQ